VLRILAILLVLPNTAAFAEWAAPQGEELKRFVAGKTVHLDTPLGTLPITYNANGTLAAHSNSLALTAYLGSKADRGRWSVKGGQVCQKFLKWFSGETSCLQIKAQGRKIAWRRDDGLTGTALLAQNDAAPPPPPSGLGVAAPAEPPQKWSQSHSLPTPNPIRQSANAVSGTETAVGRSWKREVAAVAPAMVSDAATSEPQLVEPLVEVKHWRTITRAKSAEIGSASGGVPSRAPDAVAPERGLDADGYVWKALAAQLIRQRADHLWCRSLDDGFGVADDKPPLLTVASRRMAVDGIGDAGCLSASPSIAEVARALVVSLPAE